VHGTNGVPSSEHRKVASGWSEEKVKVALCLPLTAEGPESIVVSGSPTTVQVWLAGLGSTFREMSIARTSSVCSPDVRPWSSSTASHPENCSPSSEHSNSAGSLLWKPKIASGPETRPGSEAIVVSGAAPSNGGMISHS
jgi:hypothetical protein